MPPRDRTQLRLAAAQPREPTCALALDQRAERLAHERGLLCRAREALRFREQVIVQGDVKEGASLEVSEHGRLVARLSPAGEHVPNAYAALAADVVLDDPDGDAIGAALAAFEAVVSSRLLRIELHRLGLRTGIASEEIEGWLAGVAIVPMNNAILAAAEAVSPASVPTLDAIHLATALQLAAEQHIASIMTFDVRLAEGARAHGLDVVMPS